jgi:hypothetical protein
LGHEITVLAMDLDHGRSHRSAVRLWWLVALCLLLMTLTIAGATVVVRTVRPERTARAEVCYGPQRPGSAEQVIPPGFLRHDNDDFRPSSGVCSGALHPWCETWTLLANPQAVAWRERYTSRPSEHVETVIVYADTATAQVAYRGQRKEHASCQPSAEGGIAYSYQGIEPVRVGDEAFLGLETHTSTHQGGGSSPYFTLVVRRGTALAIYRGNDREEALTDGTAVAATMCRYNPRGC